MDGEVAVVILLFLLAVGVMVLAWSLCRAAARADVEPGSEVKP